MQYSSFTPSQFYKDIQQQKRDQEHMTAQQKKQQILNSNNLIEMISDYLGMSSYYLDANTGKIMEFKNTTGHYGCASHNESEQIKSLNKISCKTTQ